MYNIILLYEFDIFLVSELPANLKKLLKWKMCSITPNIVRSTISRSNFSLSSQKADWIGVWGSHMKPENFKYLKEYQKFNHLPGSFQIGRKDRLCRNLCHAQAVHGKAAYNFVPMTFVLPFDLNLLKTEFETKNCKWILKPVSWLDFCFSPYQRTNGLKDFWVSTKCRETYYLKL